MSIEMVLQAAIAIIVALIGFGVAQVITTNKETKIEIKEHIKECNQIPKSTIMVEIKNITEKIEEHKIALLELKNDFRDEFKLQRVRYHELSQILTRVAMKLEKEEKYEQDKSRIRDFGTD
jgi:hypothetical protein